MRARVQARCACGARVRVPNTRPRSVRGVGPQLVGKANRRTAQDVPVMYFGS